MTLWKRFAWRSMLVLCWAQTQFMATFGVLLMAPLVILPLAIIESWTVSAANDANGTRWLVEPMAPMVQLVKISVQLMKMNNVQDKFTHWYKSCIFFFLNHFFDYYVFIPLVSTLTFSTPSWMTSFSRVGNFDHAPSRLSAELIASGGQYWHHWRHWLYQCYQR